MVRHLLRSVCEKFHYLIHNKLLLVRLEFRENGKGQGLRGRALGFPTANVRLARPRAALHGIFAVKCFGAATRGLEGVASLGTNPAVKLGGPATLEAFLFDFSGDLYGRRLTIEFHKKLRDEAHFASLDALAAQIRRDCDAAREYFSSL